jgi:molecular chaperone GrpE
MVSKKEKSKSEKNNNSETLDEKEITNQPVEETAQEDSNQHKKGKKEKPNERVQELENALMQKNDQYLRLQAEFDNYRKRTLKEKMELIKTAGEGILLNILPVIDDFERALKSMEGSNDATAVKDGLDLIYKRFSDFVKQNGVKEIEAKELDFDTDLHEAITKIPAPNEALKGKVIDVIQKGYLLNDKVIRFAKVVIGE